MRLKLLFIFFVLLQISGFGQTTQTFNSSGTFIVPAGVTSIDVKAWGAGGGGGGSFLINSGGGGGGGGGFRTGLVSVIPIPANAQISYTVGQGGIGGSSSTINGADGGSTIFSTITANGGAGGKGPTGSLLFGLGGIGAGGAGGTGGNVGGAGANAVNLGLGVGLFSGGGGGGAGSVTAGSPGTAGPLGTGGNGGTGGGGNGGNGKALLGSGDNGLNFGGGGGGGLTLLSVVNSTGGNGGAGKIEITYTCPTYGLTSVTTATPVCNSGISTVTLSSSTLPVGTYTVTYNTTNPVTTGNTATMIFSGAAGTFNTISLSAGATITVGSLTSASCSNSISTNNVATVNTSPAAPTLGTATQPNCVVSTGSIVLSGLPVSGTVHQAGNVINNYTITNATGTMTIAGLAVGTYSFSVSNGSCLSSSTANVVINPPVIKTWDGFSWSPAGVPSLDETVIFTGNANIIMPLYACSCQINSGANVVVGITGANNDNAILMIRSGLNVIGQLTFENNASLIQLNDDGVNSGNITYKRTTSPVKDFDYVYWSSPVEGQTIEGLSPLSDKYWSWILSGWFQEVGGSTTMTEGKGYIARVPRDLLSPYQQTVQFIGTPNNGDISIATIGAGKGNLIGNPYPSAIDAKQFMLDNKDEIDLGTLRFWTHHTPRTLNDAGTKYEYVAADYAFYNLSGSIGTGTVSQSGSPLIPNGTIAAGQSFFVTSKNENKEFKFTNSMRIGDEGQNDNFFKQTNTKKTANIHENRVWLNLTNAGGAFKQLLVGYITGASNDLDKLYDGMSLGGNTFVDFYSVMNTNKLAIQGRGLPFDEEDEVPLGYKTTIEGIFEISIDKTDGFLANQEVFLEDKTTKAIHDLTKGSYSFTTAKGEFKDRFVLRYANSSLGTADFEIKENGVIVSVKNSLIKINSFDQNISLVKVYDLKGSLIYEKNELEKNEFIINNLVTKNQVLIVMTQLENGKKVSQKIILHD